MSPKRGLSPTPNCECICTFVLNFASEIVTARVRIAVPNSVSPIPFGVTSVTSNPSFVNSSQPVLLFNLNLSVLKFLLLVKNYVFCLFYLFLPEICFSLVVISGLRCLCTRVLSWPHQSFYLVPLLSFYVLRLTLCFMSNLFFILSLLLFFFIFFLLFKNYFFCFFICLLRLFLFLFLYTLLFLFLSISTFTSLFFKLFKFLNTPLKLFLFLPCFLTYFFNLYHHNQLAFSSNHTLDTALLPPPHLLGEFQVVSLALSISSH